jgi:hypothetical protein
MRAFARDVSPWLGPPSRREEGVMGGGAFSLLKLVFF